MIEDFKSKLLFLTLLLLGIVNLLTALLPAAGMAADSPTLYRVTRVVDGDTIIVDQIGRVRYIGINTPEIHHPRKAVERFGREAAEANHKLVYLKMVRIETDVQLKDRYGRVLAYVYVDDVFVNAWLVENGCAQVMTVPPNVRYADLFVRLQREAREAGRGMWKAK